MTDTPAPADVAERVRVILARQRRTGASVARAIGMEPRAFRKRTRAEIEFSAAEIGQVARELGVPADDLVAP